MKINRHTFLHYVLITLLMFAPLRGMAELQQKHCDMSNDTVVTGSVVSEHSDVQEMSAQSMDGTNEFSSIEQTATQHNCCCCESNSCASDCDMSVSVSLLLQQTSYIPNFINDSAQVVMLTDLIKREFTPPFRPPLVIHS